MISWGNPMPILRICLLLSLCLSFTLLVGAQPLVAPLADSSAFQGNLFKLLQDNPLPYDRDIANLPIARVDGSTATLVQVRSKFSGTYTAGQDEMLYIIAGRGVMMVGGQTKPIQPGDLIVIQSGQSYTIENRSAETLVALAVVSQGGP
jgi:uncharacterized cupin superfamily protein